MTRETLPNRRQKIAVPVEHDWQRYTLSLGLHDDGRVGEVFLNSEKTASALEALARDGAILISLAIQHGCSVDVMRHAITRGENDAPATVIGAALDAIAREAPAGRCGEVVS